MSKNKNECYCCNAVGLTDDHIPPKCFFPSNHRKNLITVPACNEHNSDRSKDDEYTALVLLLHSQSEIALEMLCSKGFKQLCRRQGKLGKLIFQDARKIMLFYRQDKILIMEEGSVIRHDRSRINRVIESIAKGIFYKESNYTKKALHPCIVKGLQFMHSNLERPKDFNRQLAFHHGFFVKGEQFESLGLIKKGSNPDIFYYQFFRKNNDFAIRMVFYNSLHFLVLSKKQTPSSRIIIPTLSWFP